jgi:peptidyl-dipeptidase A
VKHHVLASFAARLGSVAWPAVVVLVACGGQGGLSPGAPPTAPPPPAPPTGAAADATAAPPTADEARAFLDDVEENLRRLWVARDRASWVNENFITDDTEALAAAGEEATAAYVGEAIKRSKRFEPIVGTLPADEARKLYLLALAQTIPSPRDAHKREELAGIETWMTGAYGKGRSVHRRGLRFSSTPRRAIRKARRACISKSSRGCWRRVATLRNSSKRGAAGTRPRRP